LLLAAGKVATDAVILHSGRAIYRLNPPNNITAFFPHSPEATEKNHNKSVKKTYL
jgi:hypothetical protein